MRMWIGVLTACCLVCGVGGASALEGDGIRMAVRMDARPFAWRAEGDGAYSGYLFDLCTRAVQIAEYSVAETLPMLAGDRDGLMAGDPEVDLMCDPMTVTVARARRVDFTPIVFIANSTYVSARAPTQFAPDDPAVPETCRNYLGTLPKSEGRKVVLAGVVAGTTSVGGFEAARTVDARGISVLPDETGFAVCRREVPSHVEGFRRFCSGELGYYFADVDILRANVAVHPECDYRFENAFFQYEPYALALTSTDADFRRRMSAAVMEMFSTGEALEIYNTYFATGENVRPMAESLKMLFRINSIPLGAESAKSDP